MPARTAIGIDFGTEAARAVVAEVSTGEEVAVLEHAFPHGVIDKMLPGSATRLGLGWALHDPVDYFDALEAVVKGVVATGAFDPAGVIGIAVATTACTMLPTLDDGTPLSTLPRLATRPHAYAKLWKHHAAQPQADRINALARARGGMFLDCYGGKTSSEWFFPKALQILEEDPEVYQLADRLIDVQDWLVSRLVGSEQRSASTAGFKALYSRERGFPPEDFFAALNPGFSHVVRDKMTAPLREPGERAGALTSAVAARLGLPAGIAVAAANMDAAGALPACGVAGPGRLVMITGTSICHFLLADHLVPVEGMCGAVRDGAVPGWWAFEAGQACVGDLLGWAVDQCTPPSLAVEAAKRCRDLHELLSERAATLYPGESGLIVLDWWNGNRSVLVDGDLSGAVIGATLSTTVVDLYRACIEATAFGTRLIIESFEKASLAVDEIVACGGLAKKNPLLLQIYADVTGRPISVARSMQAPALSAAIHAAVAAGRAAGGHDSLHEAISAMAHLDTRRYVPDRGNGACYDALYDEYRTLHDYFGRGVNDVMKRLRDLARQVRTVEHHHAAVVS